MPIEPIKNDVDHKAALARVEALWNAPDGSPESFELDALATLVERYEDRRWPIARTAPLEALKFIMEQQGLTRRDLAAVLGSRSRASEILTGKRELNLAQISLICRAWRAPPAPLIGLMETA
jgi:antitoxin component HigA of HigAB toxin-antitoxin module